MSITPRYDNGVKEVHGDWTHTDGDANESFVVCGTVLDANFTQDTSTAISEVSIKWSQSVSGRLTTITVYCNATVTAGKFIIFYTPN